MRRVLLSIAFISSQAFILYASLSRISPGIGEDVFSGSPMHFLAFFGTSLLLSLLLLELRFRWPFEGALLYSGIASVAIEILQRTLTDHRVFSRKDMLAGALGALAFYVLGRSIHFMMKRRREAFL
jgi:hypothetical protein